MKTAFFSFILSILISTLPAQESLRNDMLSNELLALESKNDYRLNKKMYHQIREIEPNRFSTSIQISHKIYSLEFFKDNVISPDILISTSSNNKFFERSKPRVYRANNKSNQILAVMILKENSVLLQLSIGSTNLAISKIKDEQYKLEHSKTKSRNSYECFNNEVQLNPIMHQESSLKNQLRVQLEVALEIDYTTFLDNNSSLSATVDWATSLYASVASIYDMHHVDVLISQIHIWDTPDPYMDISGLNNILTEFGSRIQNDYLGDVVQLLSSRMIGGGLAHLDKLCQAFDPVSLSGPYCVSGNIEIGEIPGENFSWNTYVTAHELGHVIGSMHTQACVWGLNKDEALDNCFATEGGCLKGPEPVDGGTMMSYCFLKPHIGINFSKGFGSEPGALIYQKVFNIDCASQSCNVDNSCDDGDPCTMNDIWDEGCNCIGVLLDFNQNGVCDYNEECITNVNVDTLPHPPSAIVASNMIMSSVQLPSRGNTTYSAGQEIYLNPGFEVSDSTSFLSYMIGCNQN